MRYLFSIMTLALLFALFAGPVAAQQWTHTCLDSERLFLESEYTSDGASHEINQTINCTEIYGTFCKNGACVQYHEVIMPLNLYIIRAVMGLVLMVLSFIRKDMMALHWITTLLFIVLAITSGFMGDLRCELSDGLWDCQAVTVESYPLVYLWGGMALVMLLYSIVMTLSGSVDVATKASKENISQPRW